MATALEMILEAIARGVEKAAYDMEAHAVRHCPVDTGRLRDSIYVHIDIGKEEAVITLGANTEYDKFVELGTVKMRAQPFIRPAIHAGVTRFIPNRISRELRNS